MSHPAFRSLDELVSALQVRKAANERAEAILIDLTAHAIEAAPMDRKERDSILVEKGREALREFTALPTLSEFQKAPHLAGVYRKDSTFVASRIFNFLIEYTLDRSFPSWKGANKAMLIRTLIELVKLEPGDLIDTMISVLRFDSDLAKLGEKEKVRRILADVNAAMLALLADYQLTEVVNGKLQASQFGVRLVRHLIDAQEFSTAATAGYKEFIEEKINGIKDTASDDGTQQKEATQE